ncbi:FAD-binding protein [Streptomyces sp. NP160]|uniref:FAD-dependent oxidoreductase n=1 Tax=Streptomyces sp. NP160 TaxID=2586637 RepID=UPI001118EED5|nr:FAD-dependent oxidoreductase [Streptomyces sp. NP160]TNM59456.1 FAD-binding protein [Streptomyces sp. NP160]
MVDDADGSLSVDADVLVLGAGISGLVSASVLLGQGAGRVVVVDGYPHVGGNHLDAHLGPYTFDIGSLVFQDDSPLLAHFPDLLPRYVPIEPTWERLNPQGRVTAYPFSVTDDLLAAGPLELARLLGSALVSRLRRRPQHTARDFAEHWLGPRFVHRSGLDTYMERFCGVPTEQIDLEFAHKRMMWIPKNASAGELTRKVTDLVRARLGRPRPQPAPENQQLARPREGFAHLYEPAVASLEAKGTRFVLGAELQRLERDGEGFVLSTSGGEVRASRVVSTVPVDVALDLCGLREAGEEPLPVVRLVSLYYSFSGRRGHDAPVLYNFSHEGTWKRLTTYSDFYGPAEGREFLGVEVVSSRGGQSVEDAAADFRRHTAANGLFEGDLRLEGSHVLDHAYPIYTRGSAARARAAMARLEAWGVESLGRQGAFEYQPTARHSTVEAEAFLARDPSS